jgi:NADH-quinone oxidoreductase subunit N
VSIDQVALLPAYCAAGTAVLALLADLLLGRRVVTMAATAAGVLVTGVAAVLVGRSGPRDTFCTPAGCSYHLDSRSALLALLFAILTLGVLGLAAPHLAPGPAGSEPALPAGEFCFLLACSMTGGVVLTSAGDLLTLIVAVETLTLPLYALVGLRRTSLDSAAGALTFFLVSVVATAVTLLGAGLRYATTGTVYLSGREPDPPAGLAPLATVAVVLLLGGLAFKVAAVPLHAWAPASYDGAPVPVAAYLSTASKLGGVVAIVAVLGGLRDDRLRVAGGVLAVLAVLSMTVGNLGALRQRRMVRLLAWSSVAQAGYILAPLGGVALFAGGVLPLTARSASAVPQVAALAYTIFYVLLELLAFAAVVALRGRADGGPIDGYSGAGRRNAWAAGALAVALIGLAGLPPGLAGLFAKVVVVRSLLAGHVGWLALVVALNAVLGLAYYVPVVATLWTAPAGATPDEPGVAGAAARVALPVTVVLTAVTVVVVVIGFAPGLVFPALSR